MKTVLILLENLTQTTTVTCPHCGKSKEFPNLQLSKIKPPLRAKCSCSQVFELDINRRRFDRKPVELPGQLFARTPDAVPMDIVIVDLSVGGIGFVSPDLELREGQICTVIFKLDDATQTAVTEDVIVRNIRGNAVGAEFVTNGGYNFDLDFYLMPSEPID